MSDIKCPFDGDFCQKKQERFDEWKRFVFSRGVTLCTESNMFDGCPMENSPLENIKNCERYRRYLYIINNIKNEQR